MKVPDVSSAQTRGYHGSAQARAKQWPWTGTIWRFPSPIKSNLAVTNELLVWARLGGSDLSDLLTLLY